MHREGIHTDAVEHDRVAHDQRRQLPVQNACACDLHVGGDPEPPARARQTASPPPPQNPSGPAGVSRTLPEAPAASIRMTIARDVRVARWHRPEIDRGTQTIPDWCQHGRQHAALRRPQRSNHRRQHGPSAQDPIHHTRRKQRIDCHLPRTSAKA